MPEAQASIYVGIDVSKDKLAVAIATGERRDEVLSLGTFENTPGSVDKLLKKLSGRGTVSVCYEAGPTGYGLYRQVRAFGYDCCVVAPSLIRCALANGSRRTGWMPCVWRACCAQAS